MKSTWRLFALVAAALFSSAAICASTEPYVPDNAKKLLPQLASTVDAKWPAFQYPWFLAGQIEQETCITLKSSKCWTPYAELKTDREWGIGLGQLTIAYNADGSERFNAFNDVKKLDAQLRDWKFENRYDASLQLIAVVVRDKLEFSKITGVENQFEQSAFMFVTYNSGSTLKDRALCRATQGCNPNLWFGNVEHTSYKSRVAVKGYKKSWFEISREYPVNIMKQRSPKYEQFFKPLTTEKAK